MLRIHLPVRFLCLCLATSPALADTEFEDSVPVELVRALLGVTPFGNTQLYSDIADAFPDLTIPDDFTILGSADYGYRTTVVLRSAQSEEAITEALTEVIAGSGYSRFETAMPDFVRTGFVYPDQRSPTATPRFCNDSEGYLSFAIQNFGGENIVNLSHNFDNDRRPCAAKEEEQRTMNQQYQSRRAGLNQYMPMLELPEDSQRRGARGPFIGGMSGSGSDLETENTLSIDWSIAEVFAHFKPQIEAQDWELDSENIGTSSASGTWTRTPEPGMNLVGTLSVIKAGDETYELKFRLLNTSASQRGSSFIRGIN